MKRADAFPSSYLAQDDLPPTPQTIRVTIRDILIESMPGDSKEDKPVAHFQEAIKPMVINNTNWQSIEDLYGDDSDNWRGQVIELYIDPGVMYAGKRVGGIRVRPPVQAGGAARPSPDGAGPGAAPNGEIQWTYSQALAACEAAGISKEDLVGTLQGMGRPGWNATRDTATAQRLIEEAKAKTDDIAF